MKVSEVEFPALGNEGTQATSRSVCLAHGGKEPSVALSAISLCGTDISRLAQDGKSSQRSFSKTQGALMT